MIQRLETWTATPPVAPSTPDKIHRPLSYRADIQGLRAVAVILVVLFHAGVAPLSGGFIGVDIFFVISGYLISKIIIEESDQRRFTLVSFYARRARRILPALFVMIAGSAIAFIAILPPAALKEYGEIAAAASLFASNIVLWKLSGYFDGQSDLRPLLHTWSLAVEEQFYLIFPLLLLSLRRIARGYVEVAVATCAAISLALSALTVHEHQVAAFYLAPMRAFELMIGTLLALGAIPLLESKAARQIAAALAFAAIVGCAIGFSRSTEFPGFAALLPSVGTAILIYTGGATAVGQLLSTRLATYIGGISYALYLWHWPALVFVKWLDLERPTTAATAVALGVAVVAAIISTNLIEKPTQRRLRNDKLTILLAALATGIFAAAGISLAISPGLPGRFSANALRLFSASGDSNPLRSRCNHNPGQASIPYENTCVFGDPSATPRIAVWGDSFGAELVVAAGEDAYPEKQSVRQITASACPPALGFNTRQRPQCAEENAHTLASLKADIRLTTIILAANYASYQSSNPIPGMEASIVGLTTAGKRVAIVYPIPAFPMDVPYALGMLAALKPNKRPEYSLSRVDYERANGSFKAALDRIADRLDIQRIVPAEVLCDDQYCRSSDDGSVLYFDDNHLSLQGARKVMRLPAAKAVLAAAYSNSGAVDRH